MDPSPAGVLISREVPVGSRDNNKTSRTGNPKKFPAHRGPFHPGNMLDNLKTKCRIKARRFKRYGIAPRDDYPGHSLSSRWIQIETNALKSSLPQLNHIHAIATPGAQDFSPF